MKMHAIAAGLAALLLVACADPEPPAGEESAGAETAPAEDGAQGSGRRIEDEVIYFVMPDRFANGDPSNDTGGIEGGFEQHGHDPTHKGAWHGGDLDGLIERLDYIEGLGATALWLTPVFVNKPVQGPPGDLSAGYHGYWITDFTDIDPHLGTREDFARLVEAARERGMRIIMDIVVNHTADVIQYRECNVRDPESGVYWSDCAYRSIADYPYTTRGGSDGEAINAGFRGDPVERRTEENFARLVDPRYAYTPFVPESQAGIKRPDWLNDPIHYHNRGNSHWEGESALYGDFAGLDDIFTEHPRVVEGMIEIHTDWISDFGIGGFRVDTARHVDDGFWKAFNPAILEHARAEGIEDFHLFGEAYGHEVEALSRYTREAAFPAVLDFAFRDAVQEVVAGGAAPSRLAAVFEQDDRYRGDERGAGILPTFVGNHDDGRIGHELLEAFGADADDRMLVDRSILAHALMIFSRGVPVIYYGDEQGFTGHGRDQLARQDMFPSRVEVYNDNRLIGTAATTADDNFDTSHVLYRAIAEMNALRERHAPLRGGRQSIVHAADEPGLLLFERRTDRSRMLVAFNTASERRAGSVAWPEHTGLRSVAGSAETDFEVDDGALRLDMPALAWQLFAPEAADE